MSTMPSGEPTATAIVAGGRKKVHFVYPDKTELVEEYDINTFELLIRKWKKHKDYGKEEWIFEIGEPTPTFNPEADLLAPSTATVRKNLLKIKPMLVRKDTETQFQWRIRNLTWPKAVYLVEVDLTKQEIVIKTTNKKYYKRIAIPDMQRSGIGIDAKNLSWMYQNNTLIVSVKFKLVL